MDNALKQLRKIFAENTDKRIFVVGASCMGKTTLLKHFPEYGDLDDYVMSRLSPAERERLKNMSQPWDEETLEIWKAHVKEHTVDFKFKPGQPLFGFPAPYFTTLDCDLIVHLDADDKTYLERVAKRGKSHERMLEHKRKVDRRVAESGLPVIVVDVS